MTPSRGWFKTYTPFKSKVNTTPLVVGDNLLDVVGAGTVEIPVKRDPNRTGVSSHGTIVLEDVLHVPGGFCNAIGSTFDWTVKLWW
jgi:hypothetical protein